MRTGELAHHANYATGHDGLRFSALPSIKMKTRELPVRTGVLTKLVVITQWNPK